jgi:hypothetical protein
MSKRKASEGAAPHDLPASAGVPPPRLGDHSSYMPETLLAVADDRIKVKGGSVLPAHTMAFIQHCGALARSPELFAGASAERPVALGSPFDEYAEADVACFLRCLYTAAPAAEDVAQPAVVRLAHALDAAPILAGAQRQLVATVQAGGRWAQIREAAKLAALCGWDDVRAEIDASVVDALQSPLSSAATPAQLALSDAEAFAFADDLVGSFPPAISKRAFGALAASFRRLHAKASATARTSAALGPATIAEAISFPLARRSRWMAASWPFWPCPTSPTSGPSVAPPSRATAWSGRSC